MNFPLGCTFQFFFSTLQQNERREWESNLCSTGSQVQLTTPRPLRLTQTFQDPWLVGENANTIQTKTVYALADY